MQCSDAGFRRRRRVTHDETGECGRLMTRHYVNGARHWVNRQSLEPFHTRSCCISGTVTLFFPKKESGLMGGLARRSVDVGLHLRCVAPLLATVAFGVDKLSRTGKGSWSTSLWLPSLSTSDVGHVRFARSCVTALLAGPSCRRTRPANNPGFTMFEAIGPRYDDGHGMRPRPS